MIIFLYVADLTVEVREIEIVGIAGVVQDLRGVTLGLGVEAGGDREGVARDLVAVEGVHREAAPSRIPEIALAAAVQKGRQNQEAGINPMEEKIEIVLRVYLRAKTVLKVWTYHRIKII